MIITFMEHVTSPAVETLATLLANGNRVKRFEMQGTDNKMPVKTLTAAGPDSSTAYSVTFSFAPVAPDGKSVSPNVKTLTVTNLAPHADDILETGSNSYLCWISAVSGTATPIGAAQTNGRDGVGAWMEC